MDDDSIRAMLARLPPSKMIPTDEPGMVAILRSRVVDARGDPDAVARWVQDHGGYVGRTQPASHEGRGPRRRRMEASEQFYAVPRDALSS